MWIYGINTVATVLSKRPRGVKEILLVRSNKAQDDKDPNQKIEELLSLAKQRSIKVSSISAAEVMDRTGIKESANHQRLLALIEPKPSKSLKELLDVHSKNRVFLILDGVTDQNNLGAIIRTSVALGVEAIILPKDRSAHIKDDVYKTSVGTVEDIDICVEVNLVRAVEALKEKGFWVYGFEEDATKAIHEADLKGNVCCIMGGEDTGIRKLLSENCDMLLKIPMSNKVQSLNVSVSCGIVLYEVQRQKI